MHIIASHRPDKVGWIGIVCSRPDDKDVGGLSLRPIEKGSPGQRLPGYLHSQVGLPLRLQIIENRLTALFHE